MKLKAILVSLLLTGGFAAIDRAHAAAPKHVVHHQGLNCGFPHPDAGCSASAPSASVTPAPAPSAPAAPRDIFSGLLTFQSDIVAHLQQADMYEAAPLNPATNAAYNPTAHECLAGMPGQGTVGQPGYIAPSIGLIAWVNGLQPLAGASVPPLPGPTSALCLADKAATPNPGNTALDCTPASPATLAVYADNQAAAALSRVNSLTSQVASGNFPGFSDIKQSCGGMLQHVQEEVGQATTDVAAFTALVGKYVLPVVAAHKGPAQK